MIRVGDYIYRNLEEQVLKNQSDIQDITSITGLLGIKIVGQITSISELPAEDSEEFGALEYGDAYILTTVEDDEESYIFYIKTRPNEAEDYDHWFNLSLGTIQGPVGPAAGFGDVTAVVTGSVGTPSVTVTTSGVDTAKNIEFTFSNLKGDPGNRIYHAAIVPSAAGYNVGDLFIATNSMALYQVGQQGATKLWQPVGILKGADGSQGLQGPKGDPGGFIHIVGVVASVALLPDPDVLQDPTAAYFVGTDPLPANNPLYIQIGNAPDEMTWTPIGLLNLATYVTVNGEYQGIWDADSKLDKVSTTSNAGIVYAVASNGSQATRRLSYTPLPDEIPRYSSRGTLDVNTPQGPKEVVNKSYLDNWIHMVVQ